MSFKAIAIDLDDTLVDTSGTIVPIASQNAFVAMRKWGLQDNFLAFEQFRKIGALSMSHQVIFQKIAETMGPLENVQAAAQAGIQAFYHPPLPDPLLLIPGALENLQILKKKYSLFLVTSGAPDAQKEKVKKAGIEKYFNEMYFMDTFKKERKKIAFIKIMEKLKIQPQQLLSFGNRLSQEIRDAKELSAKTCYFKYGEHLGEQPQDALEVPDYAIDHHNEFISACQL